MKVSVELLNALMKTLRQMEKANGFFSWSPYSDIMKVHLLDNELYFRTKLVNEEIKKFNYYEDKILKQESDYSVLLKDLEIKVLHREFSENLVSELAKYTKAKSYQLSNFDKYSKNSIDYTLNAMQLFKDVYTNFPSNEQRYMFASTMLNAYLKTNDSQQSSIYLAEVIKSNFILFQSSMIDEDKATITLIRLIGAQLKKNNERISKTVELIEDYEDDFYNETIREYMFKNPVFTISNFTEANNISYNTGKKYLKELVQREVISPVKISRNNAFIFNELYNIWIK